MRTPGPWRDCGLAARRGFTLMELLTVIAVIAVLSTLIGAALFKAVHRAQRTRCAAHLAGLGKSFVQYAAEYGSYLVAYDIDGNLSTYSDQWYAVLLAFMDNDPRMTRIDLSNPAQPRVPPLAEVFRCPSDEEFVFGRDRLSYGFNADVKYSPTHTNASLRGQPYTFSQLDATKADDNDRAPDRYTMGQITNAAQFILLADTGPMSGDSTDPTNRIYRSWARPRKVEVNASGPAASAYPASGIHDGDANLLYADGHVDTVDLAMYDPANDEIPVTNSEWFRYWSLESQ